MGYNFHVLLGRESVQEYTEPPALHKTDMLITGQPTTVRFYALTFESARTRSD